MSKNVCEPPLCLGNHEVRVDNMDLFVKERPYTLDIVNAPCGFNLSNSNDVKYAVSPKKGIISSGHGKFFQLAF